MSIYNFHKKYQSFTSKVTDSNYVCMLIFNFQILHQSHTTLLFFSYVKMIQNHPPTPVRNSKYLAIPPTHLFTLTKYKMAPKSVKILNFGLKLPFFIFK